MTSSCLLARLPFPIFDIMHSYLDADSARQLKEVDKEVFALCCEVFDKRVRECDFVKITTIKELMNLSKDYTSTPITDPIEFFKRFVGTTDFFFELQDPQGEPLSLDCVRSYVNACPSALKALHLPFPDEVKGSLDDLIPDLQRFSLLEHLGIGVDESRLPELLEMFPRLNTLSITSNLSQKGIDYLMQSPLKKTLEDLYLIGSDILPASLAELNTFSKLNYLRAHFSPALPLSYLLKLQKIEEINLEYTQIDLDIIGEASAHSLKVLNLRGCSDPKRMPITEQAIDALRKCLPSVKIEF